MIVKDEAHVIVEALACAAPHIDRWVIVDTGSTDGTPELIQTYFSDAGIPGEVHNREWVDFGHNRSEALGLVGGACDFAWVLDADDVVEGDFDLTRLDPSKADAYLLRFGPSTLYWRPQVFATRRPWRYHGVVHEYPGCDDEADRTVRVERLEGDYHLVSRRLGARNSNPDKYDEDCALLEAALERDPDDARSRFYLAQSHLDAGRPAVAADHYRRRMEIDEFEEERFVAAWRRAQSLERAGSDPELVVGAYLTAHQIRPTRAEPLCDLSHFARSRGEHAIAYTAARTASEIEFPDGDTLFVDADAHRWRAQDEAAMAAFWMGRYEECVRRSDRLLWSRELPLVERERVLANRDFGVEALLDEPVAHPGAMVSALTVTESDPAADVTVTITTCMRRPLFEQMMDTFLTSVTDLGRVARWLCIDDGSTTDDIAAMRARYPFLDVVEKEPGREGHAASMNLALDSVDTRWWLHLEDDWRYFSIGPFISHAVAILEPDDGLGQVVWNRNYATSVDGRDIVGGEPHVTAEGIAYRIHEHHLDPPTGLSNAHWPHFTLRPSVLDPERIRSVGRFSEAPGFEIEFARRYTASGLRTAFFDTTTSIHTGGDPRDNDDNRPNAYQLAGRAQWGDVG